MTAGQLPSIETSRLLLRPWRDEDFEPFAGLTADPKVMEYFPALLTREESDALAQGIAARMAERGFGLWAVEVPGIAPFIGFVGLSVPSFEAHFTPCVEVGWRLARAHWGKGYASEAANASLRFGFETVGLEEIVSFTVPQNLRSRAVMERIGMHQDPDGGFDHPRITEGHPLRRQVLYRMRSDDYRSRPSG